MRSELVHGQISPRGVYHLDYEPVTGRASASSDEDDLRNESNGLHPNGEILAPKSLPLSTEPTCEELRAMWIFSKRQSRAAEMSNEIPTYRDPFAYNVWEPMYPQGRGIDRQYRSRMMSRFREPSRPVFGRVISREPVVVQPLSVRARFVDDMPRLYGSESRSTIPALQSGQNSRRYLQYRFSGPYNPPPPAANTPNAVHQGSFQKLKELIWTERAKELTQQRKAEEMAARAAALKEIAAGQHIRSFVEDRNVPISMEDNLSMDRDQHYQHNTDSRISIANAQSGIVKSIFSGNPASNSARSGRLLLPGMISDGGERATAPKNFPMRPSHFRERNRVLFRQSPSTDYYQREPRSGYTGNDYRKDIIATLQYENKLQSAGIKHQLGELYRKLFQLDKLDYPAATSRQTKLSYDNNVARGDSRPFHQGEGSFTNDYPEISTSNEDQYY